MAITILKTVHLLRHAEAEHNAGSDGVSSYRVLDPSLKPTGWKQVEQLRKQLVINGIVRDVELVVVSPSTRTLQTAVGVFSEKEDSSRFPSPLAPLTLNGIETATTAPLVASELCRELITPYECNKRRPVSTYKLRFPMVDFSEIKQDEDVLWSPRIRESTESLETRRRAFLQWLMDREEENIAVVSHGGFLKRMVNKRDQDGAVVVGNTRRTSFRNCELYTVALGLK